MRVLITLLICSSFLQAQSPYQLKTSREVQLFGAGAGLNGISTYLNLKTQILTPEEIRQLDATKIWGIDRGIVNNFSRSAQKTSDKVLVSSFALPLTLLLGQPARDNFGEFSLLYFQTLFLNFGVTNVTKTLVKRPRPYMYNPDVPLAYKMKKSARYSFFSGHTSFTATNAFLTAKMFDDFNPDSKATPFIWGLAAAIPAYTGLKRIKGGKHFFTDVVVGYLVGAGIGILVPSLHK